MNKPSVIKALIKSLEEKLDSATRASKEAADYATNDESRAESKWDTQGLEASYLAAGQAEQAHELMDAIGSFSNLSQLVFEKNDPINIGALLEIELGGESDWYLIAAVAGGITADYRGKEFTIITPQSPIGSAIIGKTQGEKFNLPTGTSGKILKVL